MIAFVQYTGVGSQRSTLSKNGLQAFCGTNGQHAARIASRKPSYLRMQMPNYAITLQTLTYNPTPSASSVEDKDLICYRVWKQVFGNAYVMDSERADGYEAESMFRAGQISLREFVRAVALTATYRRRFFECCGPYRAVELNIKHLLGRGPLSQEEISEHVQRIANEGFEADINSYIDSEEYDEAFGDRDVPFQRFKGTYQNLVEFTRMCALYSAPGTSDKSLTRRARALNISNSNNVLSLDGAGVPSRLTSSIVAGKSPPFVSVKKGIPSRPDLELAQSFSLSYRSSRPVVNKNANPVRRVEIAPGNYMYLSEEEIKSVNKSSSSDQKLKAMVEAEINEAKEQIKKLQDKIQELSLSL